MIQLTSDPHIFVPSAFRKRLPTLVLDQLARRAAARFGRAGVAFARPWLGRTEQIIIAPHDLRTTDATRAAEIYAGRFVFVGKAVVTQSRSIFATEPPSEEWEAALLGFGWLRHLRAADHPHTRAHARTLVEEWMKRSSRRRSIGRRPDVAARRMIAFLSQASLILANPDDDFYNRFLKMLAIEIRLLRDASQSVADGVPRLQVQIALCYAALCMAQQGRRIRAVSRKLAEELQRQILPDGGHISRNPGALVELLVDLLPLRQTFAARNIAPPPALLNAIDRMMPMLRFFRHGDGSFALFNGMSHAQSHLLATLLAYDDTHGQPIAAMPHTGYQRIDAGGMAVIVDTGRPPPFGVSREAHAGCLSFELSSRLNRIVVNCGIPLAGRESWRGFARSTPAHSTMTYRGASSCRFVEAKILKRFFGGVPIAEGPVLVENSRETLDSGTMLTLSHDGYAVPFGVTHRRVLIASADGTRLDGEDSIAAAPGMKIRGPGADFALRFHLHPAVKISQLPNGRGATLTLPNRDVWTFEALDDEITLEDSVFLSGNDGPRRTQQIVIRQDARIAASIRWRFSHANPVAQTAARRGTRGTSYSL